MGIFDPARSRPRRIVNALRWRLKRHQLGMEAAAALADARSLGFPLAPQQTGGSWIPAPPPARPLEPAAAGPANGAAAATVCTLDHLHFALALACSIRRHHPDLLLHILVVDGDGVDLPDVPGSRLLRGSDVGLLADPYLALKYSATDLVLRGEALSPPACGGNLRRRGRRLPRRRSLSLCSAPAAARTRDAIELRRLSAYGRPDAAAGVALESPDARAARSGPVYSMPGSSPCDRQRPHRGSSRPGATW